MTTYELTYNLVIDIPSVVESALEGNSEYVDWDFLVDPDAKENESLAYDILDTVLSDEGLSGMTVRDVAEGCPLIVEDIRKEIATYAEEMQAKNAVDKTKVHALLDTLKDIFSEESYNRFYNVFQEHTDITKTETLANALADATPFLY